MAWYWVLLFIVLIFAAGWVVSFFVMRNNPRYFNIDKMAKAELQKLADNVSKAKAKFF